MEINRLNISDIKKYEKEIKGYLEICLNTCNYDKTLIQDKYDNLLNYVSNENTYILGAFINEKMVGFIWAYIMDNLLKKEMHIAYLAVSEDQKGNGLGSSLIKDIKQYAINSSVNYITLNVASNNENAINFYKKNGFNIDVVHMTEEIKK